MESVEKNTKTFTINTLSVLLPSGNVKQQKATCVIVFFE